MLWICKAIYQAQKILTIDNGNLYVLNFANNTVLKYIGGKVFQTITLDDIGIKGIKIASDNNNLYVLGNDYSIKKIDSNGILCDIEYPDNSKYEAITDFNVINDYLYISTSEGDYGTTYKVDLYDTIRADKKIDSFEGRV